MVHTVALFRQASGYPVSLSGEIMVNVAATRSQQPTKRSSSRSKLGESLAELLSPSSIPYLLICWSS
jgi:hypothetical protein